MRWWGAPAVRPTTARWRYGVAPTPWPPNSIQLRLAEAAGRTAGDGLEDEVELARATRVGDRDSRAGERVVSGFGVDVGRGQHRAVRRVQQRSVVANSNDLST